MVDALQDLKQELTNRRPAGQQLDQATAGWLAAAKHAQDLQASLEAATKALPSTGSARGGTGGRRHQPYSPAISRNRTSCTGTVGPSVTLPVEVTSAILLDRLALRQSLPLPSCSPWALASCTHPASAHAHGTCSGCSTSTGTSYRREYLCSGIWSGSASSYAD